MPAGDPQGYGRPTRGTPLDHMGIDPFTFDALHGTSVPTFEVSHHVEDFGKNAIYVDLETTGLRTESFNVLNTDPRRTSPGIMEMATFYREAGETTAKPQMGLTGYSDVIPKGELETMTDEKLVRITQRERFGPGSRVDEGVLREGKLRNIFMDYVDAAKTGKYPQTDIPVEFRSVEDYVSGFADLMDRSVEGGKKGVIHGWNINFDINVLMDTAKAVDVQKGTDYADRITRHLSSGDVEVKDLDAPIRKYTFHKLMKGEMAPEGVSRKKINEALQAAGPDRERVAAEISEDVSKHGVNGYRSQYVEAHNPLVKLAADSRAYEGGDQNIFKKRLTSALREKRPMLGQLGQLENETIEEVAEKLSSIARAVPQGEEYDAFLTAQRDLRQMINNPESSQKAKIVRDMIQGAYGDGRKSLLGDLNDVRSHLPWKVLEDLHSALDYVGGRTQDILADLMGHPMASAAHVAMADIPMGSEMSSRLEVMVNAAIDGSNTEADAHLTSLLEESKNRRFTEIAAEATRTEAGQAAQTAGRVAADATTESTSGLRGKLSSALSKVGGWKGAAAIGAAGYLAYELFDDDPHIEGVRASTSQYDMAHGIAPTGDMSLTPFSSGRDFKYQMAMSEADRQKSETRALHRRTLSAGREAIHSRVSPIGHSTTGKAEIRDLRTMVELASAKRDRKSTILPAPPSPRADQNFSYYDMASQARFSDNVQSNSHASVMEHPDHDHRAPGISRNAIPSPSPKQNMTPAKPVDPTEAPIKPQRKSEGLSGVNVKSTMKTKEKTARVAPPEVKMPSKHVGNSKLRDQGAKNLFTPPPVNNSTTNKSRQLRGQS